MKYLALIQARCGSSRLPNKVLLKLGEETIIEKVISRVRKSKYVDEAIVATSVNIENLPLIRLCAENGTRVFVGSENDVLDRFYQAAKLLKPDYIVRVTADCPVYDSRLLDKAIEDMRPDTDYMGDTNEVLADGLDIEIISFRALELSWKNARLESEREHVTLYVKNHPELFVLQTISAYITGIAGLRLTVDEQEDYELIKILYNHFGDAVFFTEDIVELFKKNPELFSTNKKYARNEGLKKSLNNDKIVGE